MILPHPSKIGNVKHETVYQPECLYVKHSPAIASPPPGPIPAVSRKYEAVHSYGSAHHRSNYLTLHHPSKIGNVKHETVYQPGCLYVKHSPAIASPPWSNTSGKQRNTRQSIDVDTICASNHYHLRTRFSRRPLCHPPPKSTRLEFSNDKPEAARSVE